jgi:hypothetical protein
MRLLRLLKKKRILRINLFSITLFLLDIILTIYYTINYHKIIFEGNPLVYYRYGYYVFILNIIYLLIIFFLSKSLIKHQTIVYQSKNTLNYIKNLYYGHHINFIFIHASFVFIYSTLIARSVVIIDWIMFGIYKENFINSWYNIIRDKMPFQRYDVLVLFICAFILTFTWYHLEYKKSMKILNNN